MTTVIKKGGKTEAFSPAKLKSSVSKSAKDAKLTSAKIKKLVEEVAEPVIALCKKKKTVKAVDIRRSLLGRLDRRAKSVSLSWRRYQRKHR